MQTSSKLVVAAAAALVSSSIAHGGPPAIPIDRVLAEGDTPAGAGGATISTLNAPFTNGLGQLGLVGALDTSARFIWVDSGIVFLSTDALPDVVTGGESTMGISDAAGFIYSASTSGDDSVWANGALLAVAGAPAPGFPAGTTMTFHSRPTMRPTGRADWIAGFNDAGGSSTLGRVLYSSSDGTPGNITVVLRSDDMVDGLAIDRPSGIDFDYDLSDDGAHHAHVLLMDTGSTATDGAVYVDGSLVVREGQSAGGGEGWENFDAVSINVDGDYLFSGDTNGALATDEFIAYNGSIAVREGDVVDGAPIASGSTLRALSMNNRGRAVHLWGSGSDETLFVGDAAHLSGSRRVLATGDAVDFTGDGVADAIVDDFNASLTIGPGLDLADDRFAFVEVDLIDVGEVDEYEAIIRVELYCAGDVDQDFAIDVKDLLDLLAAWGPCPPPCPPSCAGDTNGDCEVDVVDLLTLLGEWGPCPP